MCACNGQKAGRVVVVSRAGVLRWVATVSTVKRFPGTWCAQVSPTRRMQLAGMGALSTPEQPPSFRPPDKPRHPATGSQRPGLSACS